MKIQGKYVVNFKSKIRIGELWSNLVKNCPSVSTVGDFQCSRIGTQEKKEWKILTKKKKKKKSAIKCAHWMPPTGIEPVPSELESDALPIEL